ncbi:MAG: DUF1501 domain-containing protein [Actinomycetota bacterium]
MSTITRRNFIAASGLAAGGIVTLAGARFAFAAPGSPNTGDAIVILMLRGGADGLSLAPPYDYPSYQQLRPTTRILPPGNNGGALPLTGASSGNTAVFPTGIEGVLGLHPALQPIHDTLWKAGRLAVMPSMGIPQSESSTRSHFSAQKYLEKGSASNQVGGGWLGRMLNVANPPGLVRGYNKGQRSLALNGGRGVVSARNLDGFTLGEFENAGRARAALETLSSGADSVSAEGRIALDVVSTFEPLDTGLRSGYPNNGLGRSFSEVATVLKANVGCHAAIIDSGGWDMHNGLGATGDTDGNFWRRTREVGQALRAFADDTNQLEEITVLVVTEFGRTINENGNQGTDHGRASTFLAMGAGIQGGVFGDDFQDTIEDGPRGDMEVLTDYRKMLSEVVRKRGGVTNLDVVFPTYTQAGELGVVR